jgi:hypothetical protein
MKVYEIPVPSMEFFRRVREGGPMADPMAGVKSVIAHVDERCDRMLTFNAVAPETNSFLFKLQMDKIEIKMCRCFQETDIKAKWGYEFDH